MLVVKGADRTRDSKKSSASQSRQNSRAGKKRIKTKAKKAIDDSDDDNDRLLAADKEVQAREVLKNIDSQYLQDEDEYDNDNFAREANKQQSKKNQETKFAPINSHLIQTTIREQSEDEEEEKETTSQGRNDTSRGSQTVVEAQSHAEIESQNPQGVPPQVDQELMRELEEYEQLDQLEQRL